MRSRSARTAPNWQSPATTPTARIFDAAVGAQKQTLPHTAAVRAVAFSHDGALLATASADFKARLFDTATWAVRELPQGGVVRAVAFSADGTRLATACEDGTARVFITATGVEKYVLQHGAPVVGVSFGPDATRVVTASTDNTARIWDIPVT